MSEEEAMEAARALPWANRRHRMDERNRIRRMMEVMDVISRHGAMTAKQCDRFCRLEEHCQAELDILNAELGL